MQGAAATRRRLLAAFAAGCVAPVLGAEGPRRVTYIGRPGDDIDWLRATLAERGYVEGRTLRLTVHAVDPDGFRDVAREAVAARPEVLMAGGVVRVRELMSLTSTIPIVCVLGSDVVGAGLAKSLARPGRNVTGFSIEVREIAPITVSLARALRPAARRMVLVLGTGSARGNEQGLRPMAEAAREAGFTWEPRPTPTMQHVHALAAEGPGELTMAFLAGTPEDGDMAQVAQALNARRVASIGGLSAEWVEAGALMSYVRTIADKPRRVAALVDKLLRGADPGTIPFEVGERAEFTLNRATARAIGVAIPQEVLLRATRVIG